MCYFNTIKQTSFPKVLVWKRSHHFSAYFPISSWNELDIQLDDHSSTNSHLPLCVNVCFEEIMRNYWLYGPETHVCFIFNYLSVPASCKPNKCHWSAKAFRQETIWLGHLDINDNTYFLLTALSLNPVRTHSTWPDLI